MLSDSRNYFVNFIGKYTKKSHKIEYVSKILKKLFTKFLVNERVGLSKFVLSNITFFVNTNSKSKSKL